MGELLHYSDVGPAGRSPALLLIHPLGADGGFWNEVVAWLSGRYRCLVPDLLSAGQSPLPDWPVDLDRQTAALEAVLDRAGAPAVLPVGCAVGAMVAAHFAARTVARLAGIVLCNPALRFSAESREMMATRVALARHAGMDALAEDVVGKAFHNLPDEARRERFRVLVRRQTPQGYASIVAGVGNADIAYDLERLDCPALVLTSGNDLLLPPPIAEEAARLLAHARLERIEQAAHFIPFQAPEAFVRTLEGFLSELQDRS